MCLVRTPLIVCVLLVSIFGCMRSPGGISPSNIPLSQDGYTPLGRVEASDCKVNLLGLIPVSGGNHIADAMNKALAKNPAGEALVDISVDRVIKYFILWSQVCTEVRATSVSVR